MSQQPKLVVLDRLQTGESANPSPEKILSGIPRTRVSNQYADGSQQFFCGVWSSTSGKWRIPHTEHSLWVPFGGRGRTQATRGQNHSEPPGAPLVGPPRL